jgi:hypothetical protein
MRNTNNCNWNSNLEITEFCNFNDDYLTSRQIRHKNSQYITDTYLTGYDYLSDVSGGGVYTDYLLECYLDNGRQQYREEYYQYVEGWN